MEQDILFRVTYTADGKVVVDIAPAKAFIPELIATADYWIEQTGHEINWGQAKKLLIDEIEVGIDQLRDQLDSLSEPDSFGDPNSTAPPAPPPPLP